MAKSLMIYGLERSGTNFTEATILENFKGVQFMNEHYPDCLPTHKHFRLYDEKHFIPITQFLNNFSYPDFKSFDRDIQSYTGKTDLGYIIVVKNPYAWYQSFMKLATKGSYIPVREKIANGQFMIDWSLFYKKWMAFNDEAKDRVAIVRYEDLIKSTDETLDRIQSLFDLKPKHKNWVLPKKVGMSRKFNARRLIYYKKSEFKDKFSPLEMRVVSEMIDPDVMKGLSYDKIETDPTYPYQNNYIPKL